MRRQRRDRYRCDLSLVRSLIKNFFRVRVKMSRQEEMRVRVTKVIVITNDSFDIEKIRILHLDDRKKKHTLNTYTRARANTQRDTARK